MFDCRTNRTTIERLGSIGFDWFLKGSRKPRKVFGPVEPFLDHLYVKREKSIRLKLLLWREPPFIFRVREQNSSVIARLEILRWFYGSENISRLSRNGPLVRFRWISYSGSHARLCSATQKNRTKESKKTRNILISCRNMWLNSTGVVLIANTEDL